MTTSQDEIVKIVDLTAPVSRVWQALTDHEAFGAWFRVKLDQPFAVGSLSTGHMTYPGYEGLPWLARVDTMEPEHHFAFRWHIYDPDSHVPLASEPMTLVTFRLEATGEGTRLTIVESGFRDLPEPRRLEIMRQNTQGWDIQAEHIASYVGS